MKQYFKNFEQFLTESIEDYNIYPSEKVWNNVQQGIKPKRKSTAIALTAFVILTILTFNTNINNTENLFDRSIAINIKPKTNTDPSFNKIANNQTYNDVQTGLVKTTNVSSSQNVTVSSIDAATTNQLPIENATLNAKLTSKNKQVTINTFTTQNELVNENAITEPTETNEEIIEVKLQTENQKAVPIPDETTVQIETKVDAIAVADTVAIKEVIENVAPKELTKKEEDNVQQLLIPDMNENSKRALQIYSTLGIGYRLLYDRRNGYSSIPFATQNGTAPLNATVFHKPAMALELGAAWLRKISNVLEFKAGVQANYISYKVKASYTNTQVATVNLSATGNSNGTQLNRMTNWSTAEGQFPQWIENTNVQVSVPIGLNFLIKNNSRTKFGIGTTVQPSLTVYNKSLLLSTDLKNYVEDDYLSRLFNVNAAIEPFIAIKGDKIHWQFGPQLRYQFLSTYAKKYPFKENLFDYGFKVAISKPF